MYFIYIYMCILNVLLMEQNLTSIGAVILQYGRFFKIYIKMETFHDFNYFCTRFEMKLAR